MEMKTVMYPPRRILIYLGKVAARSKPRSSLAIGKRNVLSHKKVRFTSRQSISRNTDTNLRDDQRKAAEKRGTT